MFRKEPTKRIGRTEPGHWESGFLTDIDSKVLRKPRFCGAWIERSAPSSLRKVDESIVDGSRVTLLSDKEGIRQRYEVAPWEYSLTNELACLVESAIEHLRFNPPPDIDMPQEMLRGTAESILSSFFRRYDELDEDLVRNLIRTVIRHTMGFGLLEIFLMDDRVEDVFIDAPCERNRVYLTVSDPRKGHSFTRFETNVFITSGELAAVINRMKFFGRGNFSQANPILETDVSGFEVRATAIGPPISPKGLALALRRRAERPWTLLSLASVGSIDTTVAGLLSFLIDGRSSMLFCGARGAGKSSLLSACLFEFPLSQRILVIEDTPEIPVDHMHKLGYKVQSMLAQDRSGSDRGQAAEDALRVSLRLGESAIVMGEVRGKEALTLYESMRTGKAGSSVLGTIHGEDARAVYDRVVNEMGIPAASFASTDVIVTIGLTRPHGGLHQVRRLMEMVEVVKDGEAISLRPFLTYDMREDRYALAMDREIGIIAKIARSWGMGYDQAMLGIQKRIALRDFLLGRARSIGEQYLSPDFILAANEHQWTESNIDDIPEFLNGFKERLRALI